MPGTPIIVSKCTKKPLFYNVEEGYITASFSLSGTNYISGAYVCHAWLLFSIAAGVIDTNLLLLNWTKKEEIYNITADSNKYLLGVANDGSLVMEKTSKSTQVGVPSMCECVSACVRTCMCMHIYAYMYVHACVHTHTRMRTHAHVCVSAYVCEVFASVHVCVCVCVCMCSCLYVWVYIC